MTTRYLTVANLKLWMRSEISTADDTFLDQAINAAETTLDNACQRRFAVAGSATPRTFVQSGTDCLFIHDCTTITSVVDNGTTLTSGTDYWPEPFANISDTGETWPYYKLRRNGCWYKTGSIPTSFVVVTAAWGWAAIPPQILEACKIIAKDEFNQRDTTGFGLVAISEAGGVGTRENAIVRKAVHDYKHPNSIGLA